MQLCLHLPHLRESQEDRNRTKNGLSKGGRNDRGFDNIHRGYCEGNRQEQSVPLENKWHELVSRQEHQHTPNESGLRPESERHTCVNTQKPLSIPIANGKER